MKIKVLNPDITFKKYIVSYLSKYFPVEEISDIKNLSKDKVEIIIIPPYPDLKIDDYIFLKINSNSIILNFENSIPKNIAEKFKIKTILINTNLEVIKDYIVNIIGPHADDKRSNNDMNLVDTDISRGFIHDVNNKVFISLTAINSLTAIIEKDSYKQNIKKVKNFLKMSKESLEHIHTKSLGYRKLFLSQEEMKDTEKLSLDVILNDFYSLLKYKASKADIDLTIPEQSELHENYIMNINPTSVFQIIATLVCSIMNEKKTNKDFPLKQIKLNVLYEKDIVILDIVAHSEGDINPLVEYLNTNQFKSALKRCEKNMLNIKNMRFKILKHSDSVNLQFNFPYTQTKVSK